MWNEFIRFTYFLRGWIICWSRYFDVITYPTQRLPQDDLCSFVQTTFCLWSLITLIYCTCKAHLLFQAKQIKNLTWHLEPPAQNRKLDYKKVSPVCLWNSNVIAKWNLHTSNNCLKLYIWNSLRFQYMHNTSYYIAVREMTF